MMTASGGCSAIRKAIPMLLDSPRLKSFLESLPANTDRDRLQVTFLKRERQYHELRNRAAQIQERCAAIAQALPDASAKDCRALQDERRDLLAEQSALPSDLTVAARLFADSLSDWAAATLALTAAEYARVRVPVDDSDDAYREAEFAVNQFTPGTIDDAYDQAYATLRTLAGQRKPHIDRLNDLRHLEELITTFVRTELETDLDRQGVKLVNGCPISLHVDQFVAVAAKAAA